MLTYDEVRQSIAGADAAVLLGNGFSRAWRDDTFSYETLYAAADFGPECEVIRRMFQVLGTNDFEVVTNRLQSASDLLSVYGGGHGIRDRLGANAGTVKDALLRVIANTHPSRPSVIAREEYVCARSFLSTFRRIYTVNYDLLLYWARNQNDLAPVNWDTDDGFRGELLWVGPETDQQIFFLHGGLHLYLSQAGVRKHAFSDRGTPIVDAVRLNLERDVFPLFVSEPSSELKVRRINANPYLSFCLRQLSHETGVLIVFGHQCSEIDRHVFTAIDASNVSRVFVGIHGDRDSTDNRRTRANAAAFLERRNRRKVEFFDAGTVSLWRQ